MTSGSNITTTRHGGRGLRGINYQCHITGGGATLHSSLSPLPPRHPMIKPRVLQQHLAAGVALLDVLAGGGALALAQGGIA